MNQPRDRPTKSKHSEALFALSKHETLSLVHDKLMSITVCVDECQRGENVSIKALRHELDQVSRLAKRAMEIISAFEQVEETTRSEPVASETINNCAIASMCKLNLELPDIECDANCPERVTQ